LTQQTGGKKERQRPEQRGKPKTQVQKTVRATGSGGKEGAKQTFEGGGEICVTESRWGGGKKGEVNRPDSKKENVNLLGWKTDSS